LPLFSAIRALSRIILLFLFPLSLFLAATVDRILKNNQINRRYFLLFISMPLLLEVSAVNATTTLKEEWKARTALEANLLPKSMPLNPILFFAQRTSSFEQEELDAMRVAQEKDLSTLNGYSGALPHHFRAQYGDDCAEYPRRILLYLEFIGQSESNDAYTELAQRVAPIGFVGCDETWRREVPMSFARQPLSRDAVSKLSLELSVSPARALGLSQTRPTHLALKIINRGDKKIAALSLIDQPLRLAWRIKDKNGLPLTSWSQSFKGHPTGIFLKSYRRDLPGDIPADGAIEILAPIPQEILNSDKTLEFTLVQEKIIWGFSFQDNTTLWAQDVGVRTLSVDLALL
jgi:hypothetical protein